MNKKIEKILNPLDKIKTIRGVTYKWKDNVDITESKIGFITQEVNELDSGDDKLIGVDYITALLVEAIKELSFHSGSTLFNREEVIINSQTVASEDNNIELNYNGTKESALAGGIFVNKGIDDETNSELLINSDGDWVTNNYIKPFGLILPNYTPTSSSDEKGELNEVVADNDYIYIKTGSGWKRSSLETF